MPTTVVERLEQAALDVHAKATQAFANDLAAYRAGVQAMGESGGTLPEAQADELIAVCQRLGIAASRLSSDAAVFITRRNINARIEAVQTRNEARRKPLPQLEQAMQEASAEFLRVKVECDAKMRAVETRAAETRRAYDAVANKADERWDREQAEMLELQNRNPHLFHEMTAEELRRYLSRT
jgi:hypothetical protein